MQSRQSLQHSRRACPPKNNPQYQQNRGTGVRLFAYSPQQLSHWSAIAAIRHANISTNEFDNRKKIKSEARIVLNLLLISWHQNSTDKRIEHIRQKMKDHKKWMQPK